MEESSDADAVPAIPYRGAAYRLPFAHLFPALTREEEEGLRRSIADTGVGHAVITYDSPTWGPDCVIDGANRLRIAGETDILVPMLKLRFTDEQARRWAEDLNIERRQVTAETARRARDRRVERVAELRAEGKSLRAIAVEVGVDQKQVQRDLASTADSVRSSQPERVTGLDGKSRPATRPKPEPVDPDDEQDDDGREEEEGGVDDELESLDDTLPQPTSNAAKKPRPKHFKGGNNVDPDHPFYTLLTACSTLSAAITKVLGSEEGVVLREYLVPISQYAFKIRMVLFTSDVIDGDTFTKGRAKFVGLHPLRGLIKLAGSGKTLTPAQVVKSFADACGQLETYQEEGE